MLHAGGGVDRVCGASGERTVGSDSLESDEEHEEQRWPHHADDRCPGRPKGQLELVVVGFGPQGELIHDVILSSRRNHDIILL